MVRDTTRVNTTFDRICTVYEEKTSAITFWAGFENLQRKTNWKRLSGHLFFMFHADIVFSTFDYLAKDTRVLR